MKYLQNGLSKKITIIIIAIILVAGFAIWYVTNTNEVPVVNSPIACNTTADCASRSICMTQGPLIAGEPIRKYCVPNGEVVPL